MAGVSAPGNMPVDAQTYMKKIDELRDRERELSELIDILPSLIWRLDPKGEPTFFNKRTKEFLGLDVLDYETPGKSRLSATIEAIAHPDDSASLTEGLNHSIATGDSFSMRYRLRRADGVYRWMSGRAEPMRDHNGAIVQWYGMSIDIEDEMRAQAALRERERELSQLVDIVPVHIRRLTPDGEPIFFNKRLVDFLGIDACDLDKMGMGRLAAALQSLVHPDDLVHVRNTVAESLAAREPYAMKYRIRRADGAYRWVDGRAEPVRDEKGTVVQWYSVSFDIDDQVHAQEALSERERALSRLVETLPAMINCVAPDGKPIYRSQQLCEFLGRELEESNGSDRVLDSPLGAWVHPDDLAALKKQYCYSLFTGEPYARRHRLRRFDGEYRWVETRAAPMRDAEGAIVQWNHIHLDIDGEVQAQKELRLAQERMARASQAASLAELSASIAHEVNQPLAAIVANSHACQRWLRTEPPNLDRAQTTVQRVIRDANSAAEVVGRIRALFKHSANAGASTPIDEIITEACDLMAEDAARRGARIEAKIASDLPPITLDRVQIQQVLINLIRNGLEAMETTVGAKRVSVRASKNGGVVQVEISDRGPGVDAPEKLFDAFFTTKENGMGMGLAISRSIVESHGGRLWAEENSDGGATFKFTVPLEHSSTSP